MTDRVAIAWLLIVLLVAAVVAAFVMIRRHKARQRHIHRYGVRHRQRTPDSR